MSHPFCVGGKYCNNDGEYEVIKLADPQMVIRYAGGHEITADIAVQEKAWNRIQDERRQKSDVKDDHKTPQAGYDRDARGSDFRGLLEADFKKGVADTSWRRRSSLGGLLAQLMSKAADRLFESYAIYRRAELHVAQPVHYREPPTNKEVGVTGAKTEKARKRKAKFLFQLDSEGATFGFYIERNRGPMDETWHWPGFVDALRSEAELQRKVQVAMQQWHLHWDVCVWADKPLIAQVDLVQDGLRWEWENRNKPEIITWSEFVDKLKATEPNEWCDLYLCAHMAKSEAVNKSTTIAALATNVYDALLPLYNASCQS
ncbi:MAG: hypothetical protein GXY76_14280 [Chloroflexi bacterium]|nr:hypothetical protein [Chloroflexota bacterium]